jgi:hypothetical protein
LNISSRETMQVLYVIEGCDWSPFTPRHRDLLQLYPNPQLFPNPSNYIYNKLQMFVLKNSTSSLIRSPQFLKSTFVTARNMSTPAATIKSLDHLVLTVKSVPKTTEWYTKNLGMRSESFVSAATPDITRYSLIFGSQKINLHELGKVCTPLSFCSESQNP